MEEEMLQQARENLIAEAYGVSRLAFDKNKWVVTEDTLLTELPGMSEEQPIRFLELSLEELSRLTNKLRERYDKYTNMLGSNLDRANRNVWRLSNWRSRFSRKGISLSRAVICNKVGESAIPESMQKSLSELLACDERSMKLFEGDVKSLDKMKVLNEMTEALEPKINYRYEALVEYLVALIPPSTDALYPEDIYDAALRVFSKMHDDYFEEVKHYMDKLRDTTDEENHSIIVEDIPSFAELAADKVKLWKELHVTPTVAKVKMICGAELSDDEAECIIRDFKRIDTGTRVINHNKEYRQDIAERAYLETVRSKKTSIPYKQNTVKQPLKTPVTARVEEKFDPDEVPVPGVLWICIIVFIVNLLFIHSVWGYILPIMVGAIAWVSARKPKTRR